MQTVQFHYRYITILVAFGLIILGAFFDLTGERQREIAQLMQERDQLHQQLDKQKHLFAEWERARQELSMVEAETEMLRQIANNNERQK